MTNNLYISLTTQNKGTRYFIAAYADGVSIRGTQLLKSIDYSINGTVNVTMAQKHQRIDNISILINGTEQETFDPGPPYNMAYRWGTYDDLADYFNEGVVNMTEWDGTTKEVVFLNNTLLPAHLSPTSLPMQVQLQIMEVT